MKVTDQFATIKTAFLGGVAGAVSSLPQSMAYGVIAFAPLGSEYTVFGALAGIYSSVIGGIVSCLSGSSKIMVSGSRAATAVIFAALLSQLLAFSALTDSQRLSLAFFAVILSGFMQLLLGLIKVGHLVKFIPQTVIAGFLNGSGLLILAGQIKPLTGFSLLELLNPSNWSNLQWGGLFLGLSTAVIMHYSRKISKTAPAGLIALLAGTAIYQFLHSYLAYQINLGNTFTNVTTVLPNTHVIPDLYGLLTQDQLWYYLPLLIPAAMSIAVISSLESLLSAAALDNLTLNRTNGNRELIGQGLGNIVVGMLAATPSSGSMGRSGALFQAGGRTRLAVIFNAIQLLLILLVLSPWFGLLPKAVVAGVLLIIGLQLFDEWTIRLLREDIEDKQRADLRADLLVICAVVAATLIWNLIIAVGLGIALAVIIFVQRMSRSVIRRYYHGSHVHSRQMRDEKSSNLLEQYGNRIVVLELDGAIFFGSADGLESEIERLANTGVDYFVLDMKRVKDIDSSGAFILQRIHQRLGKSAKQLVISYLPKEQRKRTIQATDFLQSVGIGVDRRIQRQERHLWQLLWHYGFVEALGEEAFLADTDTALAVCEAKLLKDLENTGVMLQDFNAFESTIFSSLTKNELSVLKTFLHNIPFKDQEIVFNQADEGDALYLVTKGLFNVMIAIPGGRQKRILSLFPGALFGEMALMDGDLRSATVIAIEDSACLRLSREDFQSLQSEHPHIALKLFAKIGVLFAKRLRAANMLISELET